MTMTMTSLPRRLLLLILLPFAAQAAEELNQARFDELTKSGKHPTCGRRSRCFSNVWSPVVVHVLAAHFGVLPVVAATHAHTAIIVALRRRSSRREEWNDVRQFG
jgi:hypothetical protein